MKEVGGVKLFNIEVCNESSILLLVEKLSLRHTGVKDSNASMYNISRNISKKHADNTDDLDTIAKKVETAVLSVIDVSEIDHASDLIDEGLESLSIVELSSMLSAEFDIELPSTIIFTRSSVASLSEYIYETISKRNQFQIEAEQYDRLSLKHKKLYVPNHAFEEKVKQRNAELYESGFSSYFMTASNGIIHEVIDSFYDEKCPNFKGNVLLMTGLNISVCYFSSLMINLRNQGFRVLVVSQLGLERSQWSEGFDAKFSVADRIITNIEIAEAILRSNGNEEPSYHVIGHSYGAICGLLLGLVSVIPESISCLYPSANNSSSFPQEMLSKILSITCLNWALPDENNDNNVEEMHQFFANNVTKFPNILAGNKLEAHLHHIEAASSAVLGKILQSVKPIFSELKIPVLFMSTLGDEVFSDIQVEETSNMFEDSEVLLFDETKAEEMNEVYDVQHFRILSPALAERTVSSIVQWMKRSSP